MQPDGELRGVCAALSLQTKAKRGRRGGTLQTFISILPDPLLWTTHPSSTGTILVYDSSSTFISVQSNAL